MKKSLIIAVVVCIFVICIAVGLTFTFTLVDAYDCCTTMQSGEKLVILQKINPNINLINRNVYYWWDSHHLVHTFGVSLAEGIVKNENQTHFAIRWGDGFKWMPKSVLAGEFVLCSLAFDLPFVLAILFSLAFFAVSGILISTRKENNSQFSDGDIKAQRLETSKTKRRELGDVSERNTCQGRRENKSETND